MTTVLCTATTALLPLCSAAQHSAAHDDGSPRAIVRSVDALTPRCPLARVGETYVRCDDLTENGVRASSRVPG
ncbi:hypothetical protein N798_14855 [Knoellia flava TL1]|uniref:Secreted protein n=1 Tax=Knoellia flava TL1 TaxID=1385518 RepID=A0ABR4XAM5_9MICO|nr:hypothetical protein N798_14855 [Knoellia flava TL1]